MFKFISEQTEEERKLTKAHSDADKELTDAKILKVITCLNNKIETVVERHKSALADLDLKIETTSSYNEQLIYSLKSGLQDTLLNIDTDLKSVSSEMQSCKSCSVTVDNSPTSAAHPQSIHRQALYNCQLCGLLSLLLLV